MVEGTEEWFDFGIPISVQAPPADQVLDAAALLRARSGKAPATTARPAAVPEPDRQARRVGRLSARAAGARGCPPVCHPRHGLVAAGAGVTVAQRRRR